MRSEKENTAGHRLFAANLAWIATGCLIASAPSLVAQDGRTGVSVAQPVTSDSSATENSAPAKPSAAIPMPPAASSDRPVVYGAYVPYRPAGSALPAPQPAHGSAAFDPDANIVTPQSLGRRPLAASATPLDPNDPDAGIVTHVPTRDGEINDGTLIRARLRETLSTTATQPGSRFAAEISEPVMQDGRVYIPVGSVLEGRVSWVSSGRRIGGRAALHLDPETITLPDGTEYHIHAQVIDTSSWQNTSVDREGTIIRKDDMKGTLEAGGLATGGAIAAGAMIAGPAGALVGAGIGAGATAIVWFKQDRQATLPKELGLTFSLNAPLTIGPAHASLPPSATTTIPGGE